jgi:hypothetical protein
VRRTLVRRRTNRRTSRLRHLLEPGREASRVPDRRIVHAQVIPALAHHHEPSVQAHTHLEAEAALGRERLGHFFREFFDVMDAQRAGEIPAHPHQNNVLGEMRPLQPMAICLRPLFSLW